MAFPVDDVLTRAELAAVRAALNIDGVTNALRTIDYAHHEIHSGSSFRAQTYVASGTQRIIAFKVGAGTKQPHMTWDYDTESSAHVTLLEAPTWTTNTGARLTCMQSNRNSGNTSILEGDGTGAGGFVAGEVVTNPTGLAGGTVISLRYVFAPKQAGNSGLKRTEVVLLPNTQYAFVLDSDDGAKGMQLRLDWYEHTPL
jgi:hypothetical protein